MESEQQRKGTEGSIGVRVNTISTPALRRLYRVQNGCVIAEVSAGGPADRAGLKASDVITALDEQPISDEQRLIRLISQTSPGTKIGLTYVRNGRQKKAVVTVVDRAGLLDGSLIGEHSPAANLGLTVQNISPEMAQRLETPEGKGVQITDVKPGSFADDVQLQRGSVILQVNRQPVNSEKEFKRVVSQLKSGQDVVFLVQTGKGANSGRMFVSGTLP